MALETPITETVTLPREVTAVVRQERTYRAVIETPRSGTYSISVYREAVLLDIGNEVVRVDQITTPVRRVASAVATEDVTLDDSTVITAAQIMEALPLFFDRWTQEDIDAGRR